jgi:DNA-binding transcriptional LysR family regulator
MNLRQIEVFQAVMQAGSITGAARLLHVSQPGISRLIRHLEIQLGVTLFERRAGRVRATGEASTLHAEIERVYRGVQHVQDVAAHLRFGGHGALRVLCSANTALQVVPQAIAGLGEQAPGSRVYFESLPTREIIRRLVAEEADLAITSAPMDHPALEARPIGDWSLICALPVSHPLARARRPRLEQVLRERLVVYSPQAPQSGDIERWLESYAIARHVAVEVRSGYSACAMAAAGVGVAFVDDLSARAHRPDGLKFLAVPGSPRYPVFGVSNRHCPVSALGSRLLENVAAGLAVLQGRPIVRAGLLP